MELRPKQERFCIEYARSGNAKAAYMSAYGTTNENGAAVSAHKLLQRPEIQERLKELGAEISGAKICAAEEIQERLSQIARREIQDEVMLPNGTLVTKTVSVRDSLKALELLAKCKGLFITKQELDFKGVVPIVIHDDI